MKKNYKLKNLILLLFAGLALTQCQKSDTVDPYIIKLSVSPTLGSYLTDKDGNTLYFFSMDANGTNNCTGGCTTAWPVFNVTGLTAESIMPGLNLADFATIMTPN